jgi:hypothetical protein
MTNLFAWRMRQKVRNIMSRISRLETTNIEQQLQTNALATTTKYVEGKMSSVTSYANRFDLLEYALTQTKLGGLFLEFGVHKAASINFTGEKINSTIHGFDSFEGLPEYWRDGYSQGVFALDKRKGLPKVKSHIQLHPGWFNETLPIFISSLKNEDTVSFLHIDCDLYSSTKTIFEFLGDRIVSGTIIVFDEYFNHPFWEDDEYKAFQEFIASSQLSYEYIGFNKFGEQVAVKIL